jgi:hypothetical protein
MLLRAPAKGLGADVGAAGHACRPAPEGDAEVTARLAAHAAAAGFAAPATAVSRGAGVVVDGAAGWTVAASPDGLVAAAKGCVCDEGREGIRASGSEPAVAWQHGDRGRGGAFAHARPARHPLLCIMADMH